VTEPADSLVLTVAPSVAADHYRQLFDELVSFLGRLIEASHPDDLVLIVVDPDTRPVIADRLPAENLLPGSIPDIWIRDFAPVRTAAGIFKFRYQPAYLDAHHARTIDDAFMRWSDSVGLEAERIDLVLDGGNFVYDGAGCAVVTERILSDNPSRSGDEIHREIRTRLGLVRLAIIPEGPREKTGHADGMVVWLSEALLGVARFQEPIRSRVLLALEKALPEVALAELPFSPTREVWEGWLSAAGVYVNALSTDNALYVPQFGLEADGEATQAYRSLASRRVVPVRTGQEVRLGGSIRCLTWEISGPEASKVLESRG
jgi:agmatine/peptidylarginine deiminase